MNLTDRNSLPFAPHSLATTGANWTQLKGTAQPYQAIDGTWWVFLSIQGTLSSTATSFTCTTPGLVYKSGPEQALAAYSDDDSNYRARTNDGASSIWALFGGVVNDIAFAGWAELDAKPDWIE